MLDTKPSPNLVADHRLRVGIDFGTTFSGVAWVRPRRILRQINKPVLTVFTQTDSAKPGEVAIITDWPGVRSQLAQFVVCVLDRALESSGSWSRVSGYGRV